MKTIHNANLQSSSFASPDPNLARGEPRTLRRSCLTVLQGLLAAATAWTGLAMCAVIATPLLAGNARATTIYNFESDFSNTTNSASSVWSYRYATGTTRDDNYALLPNVNNGANGFPNGVFAWQIGGNSVPLVGLNEIGSTQTASTVTLPAGASDLHPGWLSDVVVRWTAPAAGTYNLQFSYTDLDSASGSDGIKWYVDQGTTDLATGSYNNGGASGLQSLLNIVVNAGDHINFIVDPNTSYWGDSTRLFAQVMAVPEPASFVLLGLGAVGLLFAVRRRGRL